MHKKLSPFVEKILYLPYWKLALAGLVVVSSLCCFVYLYAISHSQKKVFIAKEEKPGETEKVPTQIVVHVAGAVARPGLYQLDEGCRVGEALEKAGGTLPQADLKPVNLAEKLRDGQKIYVPVVGERVNSDMGTDASGKINVNEATAKELEALPGIGPTLAKNIVEYREKNGGFKSVEELKKVKGIGDKKFNDIKDLITI